MISSFNKKKEDHDQDFLIALQIQYDDILDQSSKNRNVYDDDFNDIELVKNKLDLKVEDKHLLNPELELIDPHPDIRALFIEYDKKYFYGKLGSCIVEWSKRMTICAGIFYLREGGVIRLSEPLLKYRPRIDLVQTLLHEMIHAYLYLTRNFKDRGEHGDEFKGHMNRINNLAGTKITVYHTFHDEVNHCRQHVWRCTGVCRTMKPFMGFVKRSMNRAPGPHDRWFADHRRKCSGTFEKISEPEEFKSKQMKRKIDDSINDSTQSCSNKVKQKVPFNDKSLVKIDNYFQNSQKVTKISTSQTNQGMASAFQYNDDKDDDILVLNEIKSSIRNDDVLVLNNIKPNNMDCPICFNKFSPDQIQNHVNNHFENRGGTPPRNSSKSNNRIIDVNIKNKSLLQ